MFQSFDETARPEQGPPRLAQLRAVMAAEQPQSAQALVRQLFDQARERPSPEPRAQAA